MKVLLLSAYAARSHVYWQESLAAMFPQWDWTVLSLPPRYFSWRVRGNPLYWSIAETESLGDRYDLVIATSMVDLATLRGLVPNLSGIPTALYFHENQFAYPRGEQQHSLLEAQMVSLYSSLAADRLFFNSHYNRESFLAGLDELLKRLPDKVPLGIVSSLEEKSEVLPVPLAQSWATAVPREDHWPGMPGDYPSRPLRLLWVGRLEYDKGGEGLYRILRHLDQAELAYELAVVGQQFRHSPDVFARIEADFCHRIVHFGYIEAYGDYRRILGAGDIVLSTAIHEFQGLAVLEAVASGCLPVVPDRLAYPEIYPPMYCYPSHPEDPETEAKLACEAMLSMAGRLEGGKRGAPDVTGYTQNRLQQKYHRNLERLALGHAP